MVASNATAGIGAISTATGAIITDTLTLPSAGSGIVSAGSGYGPAAAKTAGSAFVALARWIAGICMSISIAPPASEAKSIDRMTAFEIWERIMP
jgi:hypothetical protein